MSSRCTCELRIGGLSLFLCSFGERLGRSREYEDSAWGKEESLFFTMSSSPAIGLLKERNNMPVGAEEETSLIQIIDVWTFLYTIGIARSHD